MHRRPWRGSPAARVGCGLITVRSSSVRNRSDDHRVRVRTDPTSKQLPTNTDPERTKQKAD